MNTKQIIATVNYLKKCQQARRAGHLVSFTTDPTWLVDMAVNRRAGWLDDPSHYRGSAIPVNGKYPKKAEGNSYSHLRRLARNINTPRLIVREQELGEWRKLIKSRIAYRLFSE